MQRRRCVFKKAKVVRSRRPPEGATQLEIMMVGRIIHEIYYRVILECDRRKPGGVLTTPRFVNVKCALEARKGNK